MTTEHVSKLSNEKPRSYNVRKSLSLNVRGSELRPHSKSGESRKRNEKRPRKLSKKHVRRLGERILKE